MAALVLFLFVTSLVIMAVGLFKATAEIEHASLLLEREVKMHNESKRQVSVFRTRAYWAEAEANELRKKGRAR